MMKILKLKLKLDSFVVGFPYGLRGKIIEVEELHTGRYTLWDKIRYRIITVARL